MSITYFEDYFQHATIPWKVEGDVRRDEGYWLTEGAALRLGPGKISKAVAPFHGTGRIDFSAVFAVVGTPAELAFKIGGRGLLGTVVWTRKSQAWTLGTEPIVEVAYDADLTWHSIEAAVDVAADEYMQVRLDGVGYRPKLVTEDVAVVPDEQVVVDVWRESIAAGWVSEAYNRLDPDEMKAEASANDGKVILTKQGSRHVNRTELPVPLTRVAEGGPFTWEVEVKGPKSSAVVIDRITAASVGS